MVNNESIRTASFVVAGVINTIPIIGALSDTMLVRLYGPSASGLSPEMQLMMRHRAVLFGTVGGLLLTAAKQKKLRGVATVVGMTSMVSYLVLWAQIQPAAFETTKVAIADVIAIGAMLVGMALPA